MPGIRPKKSGLGDNLSGYNYLTLNSEKSGFSGTRHPSRYKWHASCRSLITKSHTKESIVASRQGEKQ
ncbi:hypothetical protein [Brenneria uluponensis]|uniref:hypothetical protein n=1 Tax=Brenneria uluponensis TaxID=3057057 RepID=UPI0028E66187|nr:hypothetical protein [Brenneria ulupoensis]